MSKVSQALDNLRGFVILSVLAFHSFMAYMASLPAAPTQFDSPPYDWTAHPIIDGHRWLGFDLFGAFQFLQLMQLMFFLSGLFVWPSLVRKGAAAFLLDRVLRLGAPFLFGVYLLMPLAYYPVYRIGAVDPSWSGFWAHWTALPFSPDGPLWFLWVVLLMNAGTAALYWLYPRAGDALGRLAADAGQHPGRFFAGLAIATALVYLPTAALVAPWQWIEYGPLTFQPSMLAQYAVYFVAGLAVGMSGFERGLLAADAALAQRWSVWVGGALAGFLLWVAIAALIVYGYDVLLLRIVREVALVLFAASACFGSIATFLRFGTRRQPLLSSISENAYGIYLFHYVFVIWAQYTLLDTELPAIAKGVGVLLITLALSWAVATTIGSVPLGARLMRGERRTSLAATRSPIEDQRRQVGLSD